MFQFQWFDGFQSASWQGGRNRHEDPFQSVKYFIRIACSRWFDGFQSALSQGGRNRHHDPFHSVSIVFSHSMFQKIDGHFSAADRKSVV